MHSFIRDEAMLRAMFDATEKIANAELFAELKTWSLSYPLLWLIHVKHVTVEGITEDGWDDLHELYEWLIEKSIMEPVF